MVTATQGGAVDAIVQFQVIGGDALLNSPDFNVLEVESVDPPPDLDALRHRPVRRQGGPPGAGLHLRPRADGRQRCSADGPTSGTTTSSPRSWMASTTRPSGTKDIDKAKAAPGRCRHHQPHRHAPRHRRPSGDPAAGPDHPGRRQGGRASTWRSRVESLDTFYGAQWCPAEPADPPCSGAAELGIVDYGHRATPDVFLNAGAGHERCVELVAVLLAGVRRRLQGVPGCGRCRRPPGREQEDRDDPQRGRADRPAVLLQLPVRPLERASRACGSRRSGRCTSRRRRRSEAARRRSVRHDVTPAPLGRPALSRTLPGGSFGDPLRVAPPRRCPSSPSSSSCTIVFLIVNVLPDDLGRQPRGPFAPQETVDLLNERLGADDPLPVQYVRLLRSTVTFDFGDSFQFSRPVGDLLWAALLRSAKLVALGLFLTIPISIAAGVFAARRRNTIRRPKRRDARPGQLVHPGLRLRRDACSTSSGSSWGCSPSSPSRLTAPGRWTQLRVPAAAGPRHRRRVLRLHRPDDPGGHHPGPRCRLHPHRRHEGPEHPPEC